MVDECWVHDAMSGMKIKKLVEEAEHAAAAAASTMTLPVINNCEVLTGDTSVDELHLKLQGRSVSCHIA